MNRWKRKRVQRRMEGKNVNDLDNEELEIWYGILATAVRSAKDRASNHERK